MFVSIYNLNYLSNNVMRLTIEALIHVEILYYLKLIFRTF